MKTITKTCLACVWCVLSLPSVFTCEWLVDPLYHYRSSWSYLFYFIRISKTFVCLLVVLAPFTNTSLTSLEYHSCFSSFPLIISLLEFASFVNLSSSPSTALRLMTFRFFSGGRGFLVTPMSGAYSFLPFLCHLSFVGEDLHSQFVPGHFFPVSLPKLAL